MRSLRRVLPLAATFLAAAAPAQAASFSYGSFKVINEQVISISSPTKIDGETGEIQLTGSGVNAGQTLLAWCLDVYTTLKSTGSYNIGTLTTAGSGGHNPALTNAQIGEIGALILNGEELINSSPQSSVATQLAIWEVEYGTNFQFTGISKSAVSLAQQYVADAGPGGIWAPEPVILLSSSGDQTLGLVPTPLPATWTMMLAVLAGFGLLVKSTRGQPSAV